MAINFHFGPEDLLRVRFALHPLGELNWSLNALRDPAEHSVHVPWVARARERTNDLDLTLLSLLAATTPAGYGVDFTAPPPTTPLPDVERELERVRATPPEQVRLELSWRFPDGVPESAERLARDPRRGLAALTDAMADYWERAIAPEWPALRALAEADIARRTRHLADRGAGAVFADLHHDVRFARSALRVTRRHIQDIDLAGRGLLLVPAAFTWPRLFCLYDAPWQPTLLYPPIGVGDLWAPTAPAGDALAPLIGGRRARLLAAVEAPASTTELATRLSLPASSVSEHLGVLRDAGLVHPLRDGRHVRYVRTTAGSALLAAPNR